MRKLLVLILAAGFFTAPVGLVFNAPTANSQPGQTQSSRSATAVANYSKKDCQKIVLEIKRQKGSVFAQNFLGRFVAWRESGCSLQCVSDSDDHSCSRFGINFKGSMAQFWGKLCGAWNRFATKVLAVDVRCALRALSKYGTRPWRR